MTHIHRFVSPHCPHVPDLPLESKSLVDCRDGVGRAAVERILNERVEKRVIQLGYVVLLSISKNERVRLHRITCGFRITRVLAANLPISELVFRASCTPWIYMTLT
jgi:hypothetical protein